MRIIYSILLLTLLACSNQETKDKKDSLEKKTKILTHEDSLAIVKREKQALEDSKKEDINRLESELNQAKTFSIHKSYSDNSIILEDVRTLESFGSAADLYINRDEKEIRAKANQLKKVAINLQVKNFPKIRKGWIALHEHMMWKNNITLKMAGSTTLELTGGIFANNSNIETTYETIREILELLRFKRVNFRWYKNAEEYTYYTITSLKDNEIK